MRDFWTAYTTGDKDLSPFFPHPPGDWRSVVEARNHRPALPLEDSEIDELISANRNWALAEAAVVQAERLRSPETRVVATGQQPGLLGGPVFTLYKAIAAVRWAERLERELRLPTVAVFWVASEDHDFDEIRSFRWLDNDGNWRRYDYAIDGHRPGMPVHDVPVETKLADDLSRILEKSRPTEFSADLGGWLSSVCAESPDLEAMFVRILSGVLGDRAPLFVSPRMKWVRRRAAAILDRELSQPGESSRRVIETGQRLRELGFQPQLHRRPEDVNGFVYRDGLRHKIAISSRSNTSTHDADHRSSPTVRGGHLHEYEFLVSGPGEGRETIDPDALRTELDRAPDSFSLNVVSRPIVTDAILPTLAYVAGPGEVGYLAQMRDVYEFFEVAQPMILPRPQVALLEPRVERALSKLGISPESAAAVSRAQFAKLAESATPTGRAGEGLADAEARFREALEFAESQLDRSDPAVARAYEKLSRSVTTGFEKLAERQRHAAASRDQAVRRAIQTASDSLWPDGVFQERAVTFVFPFLNLFGNRLAERLIDRLDLDTVGIQPLAVSSLIDEGGTS